MRISYPYSKVFFYLGIVIVLITFILGIVPLLIQRELITPSFAENLVAECVGIFLTVILIMGVLDLREYFQWRPAKDMVLRKIGRELRSVFTVFTHVCEGTTTSLYDIAGDESSYEEFKRRTFKPNLESLRINVKLNDFGRKEFLEGKFAKIFRKKVEDLADIEARYSRFLGSSLRLSLMRTQEEISDLAATTSRSKEISFWYGNEEVFLGLIERRIHNIVREIYKMHEEMEIEIW